MAPIEAWRRRLRIDPVPGLLASPDLALAHLTRRDLLEENPGPPLDVADLREPRSILRRQREDGAWTYPGHRETGLRSREDYDQIESFRSLAILVEKHGLSRTHPAIERAAEYFFSRQTDAGDFRGVYGTQYSPNYSAAVMELLIKAGYADDGRIALGFRWLLSLRQEDGGWAIPLRTRGANFREALSSPEVLEPDRTRPFSHLVTGVVLRAFAAHPGYRRTNEAVVAGSLLATRFFERDPYPDRNTPAYWTRVSFPFWFTDLVSALDSLSLLGLREDHGRIADALAWLRTHQNPDGSFAVKIVRGRAVDTRGWVTFAACRALKRFTASRGGKSRRSQT